MALFRYYLLVGGTGMIAAAIALLSRDLYLIRHHSRLPATPEASTPPPEARWRAVLALALLAWGPILLAVGIVIAQSGMAGVGRSQTGGTHPASLLPDTHFAGRLAEDVILCDARAELFASGALEDGRYRPTKALAGNDRLHEIANRSSEVVPDTGN